MIKFKYLSIALFESSVFLITFHIRNKPRYEKWPIRDARLRLDNDVSHPACVISLVSIMPINALLTTKWRREILSK